MTSPEPPKAKRRLRKAIDDEEVVPIDVDDDEAQLVSWLREKRKPKKREVKDSDESSSGSEGGKHRKRVKKATSPRSGSTSPKAKGAKKFEKERSGMLSFLQSAGPTKLPGSTSASTPASQPVKSVTDVASFFGVTKAAPQSQPKQILKPTFDWKDEAGVSFDGVAVGGADQEMLSRNSDRAPAFTPPTASPVTLPTASPVSLPPPSPVARAPKLVKQSPAPSPAKKPGQRSTGRLWEGDSVVITGVLSKLGRDETAHLITTVLGGKVTGAVSSKTAYLVVGYALEDGREIEQGGKWNKAQELIAGGKKGPKIIKEDELLVLLGKSGGGAGNESATRTESAPVPVPANTANTVSAEPVARSSLWSEKYRPERLSEMVGNPGPIQRLQSWLSDWQSVILKGEKKAVSFRGGSADNVNARAALVSGPPGIGKTTAVRVLCKSLGYTPIEYNASDNRSKLAVEELAAGISGNQILGGPNAKIGGVSAGKGACLVMDEVDGMSGGDRGGSQALIALIKKARVPVICICNDRMHTKVRSLANHCFDVRFNRPGKQEVARRAGELIRNERTLTDWNDDKLQELAESVGCDIRQVVNHLEICSKGVLSSKANPQLLKDQQNMQTPFDVCKILLTSIQASKLSFNSRLDLVFVDYDMVPLLVQQNYLRCVERVTDPRVVGSMAVAADLMAAGDRVSKCMRNSQNWSLLSEYCVLSSVGPAFACNNALGFPEFPAWLGRNSTTTKNRRLLKELRVLLGGPGDLAKSAYTDVLYNRLVRPLMGDEGAVSEVVGLLNNLEISKDVLTDHLTELRSLPGQKDLYKEVDPKIKAALTRAYNASPGRVRFAPDAGPKRVGKESVNDEGEDEEETKETSDSEETKETVGGLVKVAKPKAKPKSSAKKK